MENLTTTEPSGTVDYRPAIWGRRNDMITVNRYSPDELPPERRHQQPRYPGHEVAGNVFNWIYTTAEEIHKKRDLLRRVEDKPRLRKL